MGRKKGQGHHGHGSVANSHSTSSKAAHADGSTLADSMKKLGIVVLGMKFMFRTRIMFCIRIYTLCQCMPFAVSLLYQNRISILDCNVVGWSAQIFSPVFYKF